jgi:uncharacterized protein (DUF305 family)
VAPDLTSGPIRKPTQETTMKHAMTALVTAGLLVLGGCGFAQPRPPSAAPVDAAADPASKAEPVADSGSKSRAPKKKSADATDVMFMQMMVSQEQETAELLDLAKGRSLSAQTRSLTKAIRTTQADEAERMAAWLRRQKQPTTADSNPSTHTAHGATTALTGADLRQLRRTRGKNFERELLNLLLGQQHNAIELARATAKADGDPEVEKLAQQVDRSRTSEITQMLKLVAAIPIV